MSISIFERILVDCQMVIEVLGGVPFRIPLEAQAIAPSVSVDQDTIEIGEVTLGDMGTLLCVCKTRVLVSQQS